MAPTSPQKTILRLGGLTLLAASLALGEAGWVDVFNGTDTKGIVKVGAGAIEVKAGELVGSGGSSPCGYFATEKEYSHYRMSVDFKVASGNTGFSWHIGKWISGCRLPSGVELNINKDIKDIWWTDVGFKSTGSSGFIDGGPIVSKGGEFGCADHASYASKVSASLGTTAWNTLELYVKGDSLEAKLNGKVWMRVFELRGAKDVPLTKGKAGFYLEGATFNVKNWKVMDLAGATGITPVSANAIGSRRVSQLRLNASGDGLEIVRGESAGSEVAYDVKGNLLPRPDRSALR